METNWFTDMRFRQLETAYLDPPDEDDRYGFRRMNRREEARKAERDEPEWP